MKGRTYERVPCPGCGRKIGAYVPFGSDGRGLVVVPHHTPHAQPCPVSDRLVVADHHGGWKVDT